jgi:small conductance mechanosensitive channel
MLERRLGHARRIMQPALLELRLVIALVVELLLAASTARSLWLWSRSRRALRRHQRLARASKDLQAGRGRRLQNSSRVLVSLTLVQLVLMLGFGVAAVPGRVPLAVAVLLQPLSMLLKAAVVAALAWLLRQLLHMLLWQWLGTLSVPFVQRARREQRYRNLLQVGRRLINLAALIVLVVWVIAGLPGLQESPVAAWLASGAVLGALALVFQGLLRDFVAGLVVLFDDHYAVGDYVEIDGFGGAVEDVGVLATVLRTVDQRVVVLRNGRLEMLVNHTKLRSGVELTLPLDPGCPRLEAVEALVQQECEAFAADPAWKENLLEDPIVRGVSRVTPLAVELSILVVTRAGQQWAVERALLSRLVRRLEHEGVALASAQLSTAVT